MATKTRSRKNLILFRVGVAASALFFFLTTHGPATASERDDFYYDVQLIEALNQAGLVNYALLHIDLLLQRYPEQTDHIHYAAARFHFSRNRRRQAREALDQIPADSPFFIESLLLNAEQAIQRGDFASAGEAYERYFAAVERPASQQPADVETFKEAVLYYAQTKIEAGAGREAAAILSLLGNLPPAQQPEPDGLLITVAEAVMTATENRLDQGREIDRELIDEQIEELLEIQWRHGGLSRFTVQAFIQAARGHILLGRTDQALELLQAVGSAAARLERDQSEAPSPVPAAFYYYARAYEESGRKLLQENNKSQAEQALLRAAAFYNRRLIQNYPNHVYADRAMVRYAQLENLVAENFTGSLPPLPTGAAGGFPLKVEEAERLYQAGQYERAIPLYVEALRMARGNRMIPYLGQQLVNAYGKTGKFLEAAAVASYLADGFPGGEGTANAMLLAGRFYLQAAREAADQQERDRLTAGAVTIWNRFVTTQPDHPNAASIAFFIAENKYSQAVSLVEQSRQADNREERERLQQLARDGFAKSIPYYQRMLDDYAQTPEGVRSHYKLGWVYYNLEQGKKAAELFALYSVLETSPAHSNDRLRARLHAGEQWMFTDTPEKAIAELQGLLDWYERGPATLNTESEVAVGIRENGANYLAWAYDMTAETIRPRLQEVDAEIEQVKAQVRAAEDRLRDIELRQERAAEAKLQAEADRREARELLTSEFIHPEAMALTEMMPSEEELRGASETDRNRMLESARQRARPLGEEYRAREIDNRGLRIDDLREQRRAWREELAAVEAEINRRRQEPDSDPAPPSDRVPVGLLEKNQQLLEHRLAATAAMIEVLEIEQAALRQNRDRREQLFTSRDYAARRETAENRYQTLSHSQIELARMELEIAAVEEREVVEQMTGLEETISQLRAQREPVFAELKEKKLAAVERFKQFLQAYPESRFAPEHLSRIGTIYLELENYQEAVSFLNQLSDRYPRHEATMKANFDLGRAQFETGQKAEAMETFHRIADYFAAQRASSLEYIARSAREAGAAKLALQAYEQLLARAEDPEHDDYRRLYGEQGRYRERLLYYASAAALEAEMFPRARELGEQLLAANPNTAYFFEVQMNIARAARAADPPDFGIAESALGQVARLAQDENLKNIALIEYGKTAMLNEARGAAALRRALGQFSQLALIDGDELMILADFDDPRTRPLIEEAIYRSALCHALLGNQAQREVLVLEYRRLFPDGQYLARINDLPAPRYN